MLKVERDSGGIAHIVGLSGGKDSTCLAIWLAENEPRPYTYVCTPTGDELPEMFDHWKGLERVLGKPLMMLENEGLVPLNVRMKALPNFRMRYCTRILKLKPYGAFMKAIQPAISYIGLRADEDEADREGATHGGDFVAKADAVKQRHPLREIGFTEAQVWEFLMERQIRIPRRTDCGRCFYQTIGEWYLLWLEHPDIYADAEREEELYGHTYRSPQRDSWPAPLKELRKEFERGRIPELSLRMMEKRKGMCRACTL